MVNLVSVLFHKGIFFRKGDRVFPIILSMVCNIPMSHKDDPAIKPIDKTGIYKLFHCFFTRADCPHYLLDARHKPIFVAFNLKLLKQGLSFKRHFNKSIGTDNSPMIHSPFSHGLHLPTLIQSPRVCRRRFQLPQDVLRASDGNKRIPRPRLGLCNEGPNLVRVRATPVSRRLMGSAQDRVIIAASFCPQLGNHSPRFTLRTIPATRQGLTADRVFPAFGNIVSIRLPHVTRPPSAVSLLLPQTTCASPPRDRESSCFPYIQHGKKEWGFLPSGKEHQK